MPLRRKALIIFVLLPSYAELQWLRFPLQLQPKYTLFSFTGDNNYGVYNTDFSLQNIDLNASAPCGAHKCFFRSNVDPDIGFLVVRTDPSRDEDLQEQWDANLYLQKKYNRRNFLMAPPPFEYSISQEFASQLNSLVPSQRGDRYSANHTIQVQTVQRAPESSILIGCHEQRQHKIFESLAGFVQSFVEDKNSFLRDLKQSLVSAIEVMEEEPWYARDWQAMMNQDGALIDIDVARMDLNYNTIDLDGLNHLDWIDLCCDTFEAIYSQVAAESSTITRDWGFGQLEDGEEEESICSTKLHSLRNKHELLDASNLVYCRDDGCLYGSVENPNVGYLVANTTKAKAKQQSNWELASLFTKEFKVLHNILGSPEELKPFSLANAHGDDSATWLVQKVKLFSPQTVLFTCRNSNQLAEKSMFGGAVNSFVWNSTDQSMKFKNRVKAEVKKITRMTKARKQSLVPNFKAVIRQKGSVYLLDLHRVLKRKDDQDDDSRSEDCLQTIVDWAKQVANFTKDTR